MRLTEQELRALIDRVLDEREAAERKRRRVLWAMLYRQFLSIAGIIKKECLTD